MTMEAERHTMDAEQAQLFEMMWGVYAVVGQPSPRMPVPPPQPTPNIVSGTVRDFTTL